MRLAIITTHPIQYYAPIFSLLHRRGKSEICVFYTWGEAALSKYDPGFNIQISWDVPLLENYPYQWIQNDSKDPGSHHFKGIITPNLIKQIEKWRPSAVLVFGWNYQGHLKAIRYFSKKLPVYFRGDSTLLDEAGSFKTFIKFTILRWVYGHVNHAFYTGSSNKQYFKKCGLKEHQLSFAPHAVDNQRFQEDKTREATELREKLGICSQETLILFAGKLEPKKSPYLLLSAFLALKRNDVHLLFVGNGPLEALLKENAGNRPRVHFLNFQNQSVIPVVYQACDLFCLPSGGPGETWGLTVNEAMACGKAILVSDKVGCARDLVRENYNGAVFESGNLPDFIQKLDSLVRSKNLLQQYGNNSRALIKDWTLLKIAEAIEDKLTELLNEKHFSA